jgi:hypothetical protein
MMNIEKFNNFIESINEAFNNPVKIDWVNNSETDLDGEFYIDDIRYLIECCNWGENIWSFKFYRIEDEERIIDLVDDSKRKMRVLSTIRIGMENLIEYKNPSGLIINVTDGSRGRDYLWGRFSKELSNKYQYKFLNKKIIGYSTFFLWRDISFDNMNCAFNKMLRIFQNQ